MRKIAKYHNDMNDLPLRDFNDKELDIFFSIVVEMRDKGQELLEFDFTTIFEMSQSTRSDRFIEDLDRIVKKLVRIGIRNEDERGIEYLMLFNRFYIDKLDKKIEVKTSKECLYWLNHKWEMGNYTKFDLLKFIELKSGYSKTLFRKLHQYKYQGFYTVSLDEFRYLFQVPESYEMKQISQQILTPCISELKQQFQGLKVTKIREGRVIKTLKFTFRKFKDETQQTIAGKLISVPVQEEVMTQDEKTSTVKWYLKNGKTYWNNEKKIWGKYEEKSVFLSEQIAETFRKINNLECEIKSF